MTDIFRNECKMLGNFEILSILNKTLFFSKVTADKWQTKTGTQNL